LPEVLEELSSLKRMVVDKVNFQPEGKLLVILPLLSFSNLTFSLASQYSHGILSRLEILLSTGSHIHRTFSKATAFGSGALLDVVWYSCLYVESATCALIKGRQELLTLTLASRLKLIS
jgi:hypothetical protein